MAAMERYIYRLQKNDPFLSRVPLDERAYEKYAIMQEQKVEAVSPQALGQLAADFYLGVAKRSTLFSIFKKSSE